jgi:D-alanine-D-alanine ligase
MARKLRVLHITHPDFLPPESSEGFSEKEINVWKTDYDVVCALRELGHEVRSLGVSDELVPIRDTLEEYQPHIVFNLLEQFAGIPEFDQHVVSYFELQRVAYTGCNPRGLTLARDKSLAKKIVSYHRVPTPAFAVFRMGRKVRRPARLGLPAIVKSATEESSFGISQASVVHSDEALVERVQFIHDQVRTDALVEEYVEGRELYVGVLGNERLTVLPIWELHFGKLGEAAGERVATQKVKHDVAYQKRMGIDHGPAAALPEGVAARAVRLTKRICRALELDGYGRVDYRLDADGRLHFLEANPNPEIAWEEEFASAAEAAGYTYPELIQRIVNLGLARHRAR